MSRLERFCDGRLVKETQRIDISTSWRRTYMDGRWEWRLDGEEISDAEAEAFQATWEASRLG